jgi:hypothetical protein
MASSRHRVSFDRPDTFLAYACFPSLSINVVRESVHIYEHQVRSAQAYVTIVKKETLDRVIQRGINISRLIQTVHDCFTGHQQFSTIKGQHNGFLGYLQLRSSSSCMKHCFSGGLSPLVIQMISL